MSRLDVKSIRARLSAATPGPYVRDWWDGTLGRASLIIGDRTARWAFTAYGFGNAGSAHPDFALVEHAYWDLHALCDRVEALEAALRDALMVADSANRTTAGSEKLSAARAALEGE